MILTSRLNRQALKDIVVELIAVQLVHVDHASLRLLAAAISNSSFLHLELLDHIVDRSVVLGAETIEQPSAILNQFGSMLGLGKIALDKIENSLVGRDERLVLQVFREHDIAELATSNTLIEKFFHTIVHRLIGLSFLD